MARARAGAVVVGALLALCGLACSPGEPPPDLVVVLIDNLRADRLGCYGHDRPTSPRLDALAAEGLRFERSFSTSSWTRPAVASIFTSLHPSEHGAVAVGRPLKREVPTLAEGLRDAGYRTLAVSGNFVHVTKRNGFGRGFEQWKTLSRAVDPDDPAALFQHEVEGGGVATKRAPEASEINRVALALLDALAADERFFLYVHYMEPHSPYDPPASALARVAGAAVRHAPATNDEIVGLVTGRRTADPAERQRLIDLYDAEVATVDAGVGALLDALAERGRLDNALVVVTSDHGEAFGEHATWFHGVDLHRESVAVPLIVWDGRGRIEASTRRDAVDGLDVPTTLLAAAGVAPAEGMRGRDLLAPPAAERALVAELHRDPVVERHLAARRQARAVTFWPTRVILDRSGERLVFDLEDDPLEQRPRTELGDLSLELESELRRGGLELEDAPEPIDDSSRQLLRALGYVE